MSMRILYISMRVYYRVCVCEVPFISFFDGFRTSHEISKPNVISYEVQTLF